MASISMGVRCGSIRQKNVNAVAVVADAEAAVVAVVGAGEVAVEVAEVGATEAVTAVNIAAAADGVAGIIEPTNPD